MDMIIIWSIPFEVCFSGEGKFFRNASPGGGWRWKLLTFPLFFKRKYHIRTFRQLFKIQTIVLTMPYLLAGAKIQYKIPKSRNPKSRLANSSNRMLYQWNPQLPKWWKFFFRHWCLHSLSCIPTTTICIRGFHYTLKRTFTSLFMNRPIPPLV